MSTGDAGGIDPHDWHVPTLAEVFALCAAYPDGGPIFLDTKLPRGVPEVARRMAAQYLELFVRFPDVAARAFVACPDAAQLDVVKAAFAAAPGFAGFRAFALDHEELSSFFLGGHVADATPLRGAGDNTWLSIGAPYMPLSVGDFDDLVALVRRTMELIRAPGPHEGKRLCVWTIDDDAQMRALAAVGPDAILTDRPARLAAVLDERYGPRGADPRRPRAMCHRGGPDGSGAPENTLPLIELGLRTGEGIELDVCAALDGAVVFHDNDPEDLAAVLRRAGSHVGQFRPVFANPAGRDLSNHRLDQLTVAEVQACYGYVLDEKGALAGVASAAAAVGRLIRDRFD
jgi:glycerophosphoryl diester phosphodiesterase